MCISPNSHSSGVAYDLIVDGLLKKIIKILDLKVKVWKNFFNLDH